jgi:uncharacterized delta-60 repeat protein
VRTGFLERQVTVDYATRDESATDGADYRSVQGTLTFGPGETARAFTVTVLPDALAEATETVRLALSDPGPHVILGETNTARLRILDDAPGAVDPTFRVTDLNQVVQMVLDGQGRVTLANELMFNPLTLPLFRYSGEGARDASFTATLSPAYVRALTFQPDGQLLVARDPVGWPAEPFEDCSMFRLNPDGSRDDSFIGCGAAPHYTVAIQLQADGRILAAGFNGNPGTGPIRPAFVRLEANGALDPSFNPVSDGFVNALALQPDGRVVVSASRIPADNTYQLALSRLNADGSVDAGFSPPAELTAEWQWATGLAVQPDGRILVGGVAGPREQLEGRLMRLEADGRRDSSFNAARISTGTAVGVQAGGKILIGSTNHVYRLNADGSLDPTFGESGDPEGLITDPAGWVLALRLQADGRVLAAGRFTTFNGMDRPNIVRLQNDAASAAGALRWSVAAVSVSEPGARAQLWVERVGGNHGEIVVNFATHGGTAPPGQRYVAQAGTVRFADGESGPKRVEIPLVNDAIGDGDQTFLVSLANPIGGAVPGEPAQVTVTIVEDDTSLRFDAPKYRISESTGSFVVGVTRRGLLDGTTMVTCTAVPGLAKAGQDYTAEPVRITFAPGATHATFPVRLIDNVWGQPDRSFSVVLSDPSGATLESSVVPVTVLDDDGPGLVDPTFDPFAAGWPGNVETGISFLIPQADGSAIAGASWPDANSSRSGLIRFERDGGLDRQFGLANTNGVQVNVPLVQCGMSLAGGGYLLGLADGGLVRADGAGAIVGAFAPIVQGAVRALLGLPDGRVVVGGQLALTNRDGGFGIVMLSLEGALDDTFAPVTVELDWWPWQGWALEVNSLVQCADGGLIVGGRFDRIGGESRTDLAKLRADGSVDPEFKVSIHDSLPTDLAVSGHVNRVRLQPDGGILIAGRFREVQGIERHQVARLLPDGALDPSFDAGLTFAAEPWLDAEIGDVILDPDGRAIAACVWRTTSPWPLPVPLPDHARVVRLRRDGSLDPHFHAAQAAASSNPWGLSANALALGLNDAIWVGGTFLVVDGVSRPSVARLHGGDLIEVRQIEKAAGGTLQLVVFAPRTARYALETSTDFATWRRVDTRQFDAGPGLWPVGAPSISVAFYRLVAGFE